MRQAKHASQIGYQQCLGWLVHKDSHASDRYEATSPARESRLCPTIAQHELYGLQDRTSDTETHDGMLAEPWLPSCGPGGEDALPGKTFPSARVCSRHLRIGL